jgi:hypothetical protein
LVLLREKGKRLGGDGVWGGCHFGFSVWEACRKEGPC